MVTAMSRLNVAVRSLTVESPGVLGDGQRDAFVYVLYTMSLGYFLLSYFFELVYFSPLTDEAGSKACLSHEATQISSCR